MVCKPVEERGRHLRIAEDRGPFAEGEVRGDDDRRLLVEAADQVEQELAAGLGEREVAELVQNDEVETGEMIRETALAAGAGLGLELVDEVDDVEEAAASAATDASADDADGEMRLAGAGAADQNQVALVGEEVAAGEVANQGLVDGGPFEDELLDLLREGQLGNGELVLDRSRLRRRPRTSGGSPPQSR